MSNNLLEELKYKIAQYEEQVKALTQTVNQKNMELNNIATRMSEIRSKLEMKKTDVNRIQNKINEKSKIANEARMAYNKILDNTSKLLQAVNNENSYQDKKSSDFIQKLIKLIFLLLKLLIRFNIYKFKIQILKVNYYFRNINK